MNWLPLCGEVDGLVANRGLFEQYHIPMPTDYDSLVAACQAFEKVGIRGFVADFAYDYTCMEVLQGLSIPEITSMEGRIWRSAYEDPTNETVTGLDAVIWPEFIIRLALRLQSEPRTVEKMRQLGGLKALVVDDDFNPCNSVTKMLMQIGMRPEWTLSGKEAVLRARQSLELGVPFMWDERLPLQAHRPEGDHSGPSADFGREPRMTAAALVPLDFSVRFVYNPITTK